MAFSKEAKASSYLPRHPRAEPRLTPDLGVFRLNLQRFIEKQAEDPSLSREGMNAVWFPINYYIRAPLISYIFKAIRR
jgi:hypothetical protein